MSKNFLQDLLTKEGSIVSKPKRTAQEAEQNRKLEQAWKAYYSQRFCPPLALLAKQTEDVMFHASVCPMCQRRLAELKETDVDVDDLLFKQDAKSIRKKGSIHTFSSTSETGSDTQRGLFSPLMSGLQNFCLVGASLVPQKRENTVIEKGDIYKLSSQLDGFDEVYQYVLAPQVLVLEVKQYTATVAVISTALDFSKTTNKNALLPYHAFVETWNCFEMPLSLFSGHVLSLTDEEMGSVCRVLDDSFRIQCKDSWSRRFMDNEKEIVDIIKTRADCLCVDKEKAWNWKEACSDLLCSIKDIFTLPTSVLQAASEGDRAEVRIHTSKGIELSYAVITLYNSESGYVEFDMHLPQGIAIEHVMVLAEDESGIVRGDADFDTEFFSVKFEENILHKNSVLTIIVTAEE